MAFTPIDATVAIFCRWPTPGKAKTRLIPGFGADGAAAIYDRLLAHTIAVARESGLRFELRSTGAAPNEFHDRYGADIAVVDQGDGSLSDKLCRVPTPAIIIGSDCPGLTADLLHDAHEALSQNKAVIGPASDGGYYLIGLREPAAFAFDRIDWSTPSVFDQTLSRFAAHDIRPVRLLELSDVDEPADLDDWPEFLP